MSMSPLERYRVYERRLVRVRWLQQGFHSVEEDDLLQEMEEIWWQLSDEDRHLLDSEPPKSLIRTPAEVGKRVLKDKDVLAHPQSVSRTEVA